MIETTMARRTGFSAILDNNKQELARIDNYKKQAVSATPRNLAFAGLTVGGVVVASFLALQIITGVIALVAIAITGVAGYFGIKWLKHLDPIMKQKMKNKQLKSMMEEARKHAIYQLDNQVIKNTERLNDARKSRNKMGASIEKLKGKLDPANEGKPIYQQKLDIIKRLQDAYNHIKVNLDKAAKANIDFEAKVKDYKQMEEFAAVAGEAMALFENNGAGQLEDMLSLEAFNHIETEFSTALISIENSARDMVVDGD